MEGCNIYQVTVGIVVPVVVALITLCFCGMTWHMTVLNKRIDMDARRASAELEKTRAWVEIIRGVFNDLLEDDGKPPKED